MAVGAEEAGATDAVPTDTEVTGVVALPMAVVALPMVVLAEEAEVASMAVAPTAAASTVAEGAASTVAEVTVADTGKQL